MSVSGILTSQSSIVYGSTSFSIERTVTQTSIALLVLPPLHLYSRDMALAAFLFFSERNSTVKENSYEPKLQRESFQDILAVPKTHTIMSYPVRSVRWAPQG